MLRRAWGIARSLGMYHGVPGRHRRMRQFYSQFLGPGDLAFDIGAHVGSRERAWRALDARVIAVEPAPDCLWILKRMYGRDPAVTIVPVAVGAEAGRARLAVSLATPTVSSLSSSWRSTVVADRRFSRIRWDAAVEVDVVTLDDLVARYGVPAFCKIDVEGFELEVVCGLTRALPALSFEYIPAAHDAALSTLDRVASLGRYQYNYSPIETMRWASDSWMDETALVSLLDRFRPLGRSGDVYARLLVGNT